MHHDEEMKPIAITTCQIRAFKIKFIKALILSLTSLSLSLSLSIYIYIYGHETTHVMKDFMFMLSMLNCDELSYYIKLLIYKNSPNEFFIFKKL
jgi:hypothetical protein